jgi:uncharacterized protein (TIGR02246 family)
MSNDDAIAMAWSILVRLQSAIEDEDHASLSEMFEDEAVVIGTSAHSRGREELDAYLAAVLAEPGTFHWEWRDVVVFHEAPGVLGFASVGDLVVTGAEQVDRTPFRLSVLSVEHPGGWAIRFFHGSVPSRS